VTVHRSDYCKHIQIKGTKPYEYTNAALWIDYYIVDTLFLTILKGLSATQITLLTTIPSAIGILIQPYLLKIIHKLGNTASVRLGAFFLLISAILHLI